MTISGYDVVVLAGFLVLGVPAAAQQVAGPPAPDAHTQYVAQQNAYLAALSPADGWHSTASGLRYRRISGPGTGAHPTVADTVRLRYTVRFTDGRQLETSGDTPVDLPLGRLIPGWQEGVPLMGVGDRYEFAVPAALAYGPDDDGPIPGGSTLVFTIDLVGINPA
jgi:FKBP-type peptidyl-prolyl cis-trans isomerase